MDSKRLLECDVVKGLAILAVVLIHALVHVVEALQYGPLAWGYAAFLETARFAVPAFLILSAFLLTRKERQTATWDGAILSSGRIRRIAFAYTFWSAAYYALMWMTGDAYRTEHAIIAVFLAKFVTGGVSIHLYFLLVIMQFYLLVWFGVCPLGRCSKYCVFLGIVLHVISSGFHYLGFVVDMGRFGSFAMAIERSFFPGWLGYFLLGRWLAAHYDELRAWLQMHRAMVGGVVFLCWLAAIGEWMLLKRLTGDPYLRPEHWMLIGNVYAAIMTLFLLSVAVKASRYTRWLAQLGAWSFPIYLLHEPFLGMVTRAIAPGLIDLQWPLWGHIVWLTVLGIAIPLLIRLTLQACLGERRASILVG